MEEVVTLRAVSVKSSTPLESAVPVAAFASLKITVASQFWAAKLDEASVALAKY